MLSHLSASKLIDLGNEAVKEFTIVRDNDSCAVESLDGLLQHVFRGHVEVVGRLVEDEQVDRLQQQANHSQTAALATAEHFYFLFIILAAKHKGAKDVVNAQTDVALRHIVDGLEYGKVLVQQLCLVLREVANLHIVANLQVAIEGDLAHDALHQRRLALAVLADKGDLLAALDGEIHVVKNHVRIFLPHLVADDGIIAAAQARRELKMEGRVIHLIHLDGHHLLQLANLLLHLYSLRGLIAETLDELTHVSHFLLLVLEGA